MRIAIVRDGKVVEADGRVAEAVLVLLSLAGQIEARGKIKVTLDFAEGEPIKWSTSRYGASSGPFG